MVENRRVITNILATAVGGRLVGSFCVKRVSAEEAVAQIQFLKRAVIQKGYLLKSGNLGRSDDDAVY